MRRRYVILALATLTPLAAAAAQSTLVSDAPVELYGTVRATGPGALLFHRTYDNQSISATIWNGTIIDRQLHNSCSGWREEETILGVAMANEPRSAITIKGIAGAAFVYEFAPGTDAVLSINAGGSIGDVPDVYLGPNPHNLSEDGPRATPQLRYARMAPTGPFFLVPSAPVRVESDGILYLEAGQMEWTHFDQTRIAESTTDREEVNCDIGGLPFPPTGTRSYDYYHSYRIHIGTGQVRFAQSSTDALLDFYKGDRGIGTDEDGGNEPRGHVQKGRSAVERIAELHDIYALPATSVGASDLGAHVEGAAIARNVQGSLSVNGALTEVQQEELPMGGTLDVTPVSHDSGRRMEAQYAGDFVLVSTGPQGSSQNFAPLALGIGIGMGAVGFAFFAWPAVKWHTTKFLLFPLYARIRKEEVLENPLRDDILHVVSESPGISASELGRRVDCGWGTLVYHLTVLERMQLLSSAREGRHKRFFVQGRINYSDKGAVGLLANPAARTILDAVRATPGVIQKDLSLRLGLSPGTVAWHVERLTAEGLIIKEEDGRSVRYHPSERLLELTKRLAA